MTLIFRASLVLACLALLAVGSGCALPASKSVPCQPIYKLKQCANLVVIGESGSELSAEKNRSEQAESRFVDALVKNGYGVVERKRLESILNELGFIGVTTGNAPDVGKLAQADAVVFVEPHWNSRRDFLKPIANTFIQMGGGVPLPFGDYRINAETRVRIVDVATGVILETAIGRATTYALDREDADGALAASTAQVVAAIPSRDVPRRTIKESDPDNNSGQ